MYYKRGIHSIDVNGTNNGYAYYILDGWKEKKAKLYYRPFRTLDDHMGNTPAGLYFIARLPGKRTMRVYLCETPCYR